MIFMEWDSKENESTSISFHEQNLSCLYVALKLCVCKIWLICASDPEA